MCPDIVLTNAPTKSRRPNPSGWSVRQATINQSDKSVPVPNLTAYANHRKMPSPVAIIPPEKSPTRVTIRRHALQSSKHQWHQVGCVKKQSHCRHCQHSLAAMPVADDDIHGPPESHNQWRDNPAQAFLDSPTPTPKLTEKTPHHFLHSFHF